MNINSVVIQGRLVREPEIKKLESGASVCNFVLAVDRLKKKSHGEGYYRVTDFFNCVAWQSQANILAAMYHKGDMIALTGSLQSDVYFDKKINSKRTYVKLVADKIHSCGRRIVKRETDSDRKNEVDLSDLSEEVKAEFWDDDEDFPF